jgi:hypothetical protein
LKDFTLKTYRSLLIAFRRAGYEFITFEEYCSGAAAEMERVVVMRHDVDELAGNALKMSLVEKELGVRATYFFRIYKQSNVPYIIEKIRDNGHEIGYHYEDLSTSDGDFDKAIESFKSNLEYFREFYPVKSICMHGSSSSKYDNRTLWKKYDYKEYGLVGEPYLSIDFKKMYYITDTGYSWDGGKYAVRDVVENNFGLKYHSSEEIIQAIGKGEFPKKLMMLAHTLWTDNYFQWLILHLREFFRNNIKLMAKNNVLLNKIYSTVVKWYWKK